MKTQKLGRTDLEVPVLGFGGLFVASFVSESYDCAERAVRRALDLGINYFDTAPGYGNSEEVLGKALRKVAGTKPIVLSTKIGGREGCDLKDPASIRASVEESLRLLGRDHADLLIIHEPDRPRQNDWWTDRIAVEGPVLGLLADLKKEGKIRYTGLGGTSTSVMAHLCRTGKFDVVLTAFQYSALYREAALEVIPAAKAAGMGILIGSPLQQGLLARRFDQQLRSPAAYWISSARKAQLLDFYKLCDEVGMSLPEMGLRFALSNPDVHCVLMGARSETEVEENVRIAEKGPLPADVLAKLNALAARLPSRPYGEPEGLGWIIGNPENYKGLGWM